MNIKSYIFAIGTVFLILSLSLTVTMILVGGITPWGAIIIKDRIVYYVTAVIPSDYVIVDADWFTSSVVGNYVKMYIEIENPLSGDFSNDFVFYDTVNDSILYDFMDVASNHCGTNNYYCQLNPDRYLNNYDCPYENITSSITIDIYDLPEGSI